MVRVLIFFCCFFFFSSLEGGVRYALGFFIREKGFVVWGRVERRV
jgi:hypothetical protein